MATPPTDRMGGDGDDDEEGDDEDDDDDGDVDDVDDDGGDDDADRRRRRRIPYGTPPHTDFDVTDERWGLAPITRRTSSQIVVRCGCDPRRATINTVILTPSV